MAIHFKGDAVFWHTFYNLILLIIFYLIINGVKLCQNDPINQPGFLHVRMIGNGLVKLGQLINGIISDKGFSNKQDQVWLVHFNQLKSKSECSIMFIQSTYCRVPPSQGLQVTVAWGYFVYGSLWAQCSTTLMQGESNVEIGLTSVTTTLSYSVCGVLLTVHGRCLCFCNQWAYADNLADAVDRLLILRLQ